MLPLKCILFIFQVDIHFSSLAIALRGELIDRQGELTRLQYNLNGIDKKQWVRSGLETATFCTTQTRKRRSNQLRHEPAQLYIVYTSIFRELVQLSILIVGVRIVTHFASPFQNIQSILLIYNYPPLLPLFSFIISLILVSVLRNLFNKETRCSGHSVVTNKTATTTES